MDMAQNLFFAQKALVTLFSVTNKLQMRGDKHLRDITIRQMLAIPAIIHAPQGKATINHIARQLGTSKQSAKQIVDAMEKKQYLYVEASAQDKRAVDITITPQGEQAFKACSERTDEFLADIFHDFTAEDLATLCALLEKLYSFDGLEQVGAQEYSGFSAEEAAQILRHHQHFLHRRTPNHD